MYTRGKVWFYLAVRRRARWAGIPFPEALADAMAWSEDVFGRIGAGSVRDHCPKLRPLDTALDVERAITAVGSAAPVQPTIEAIAEYLCPYWCEAE